MKIALLGYGTVGSGVFELIEKNKESIQENFSKNVRVKRILVNNLDKYKAHESYEIFTNSFEDLIKEEFDIAIETIGGIYPAYDYLEYFLKKGIPVITANKDLIAEKGADLLEIAKLNNTILSFEASVGGGIPILKPLQECLAGNTIKNISAVINGTTNYILTKMFNDDVSYETALELAQEMGFAESDPTSDVEGYDAMRKLVILSSIGYKKNIKWTDLPIEGISNILKSDIDYAHSENYRMKLMAFSEDMGDGIYGTVRPVYVTSQSKYAKIDNEYNAVILEGDAVGELMFTGKGAGKFPTASSILGDMLDIIQNKKIQPSYHYQDSVHIHQYYPKKSKWVIRLTNGKLQELTMLLFECFSSNAIKLSKDANSDVLYVQLVAENEETLLEQLNQIAHKANCKYKHFLVFDK